MATVVEKWLGPGQIADRLGIDVRHVARLADRGTIRYRNGKRGREYPWPECRDRYDDYRVAERIGNGQGNVVKMSLDEERAALLRVQRQRETLKLEQEQKTLVPAAYMHAKHEELLARLAGVVRTWPERWTATMVGHGLSAEAAEQFLQLQEDTLVGAIYDAVSDADQEDDEDDTEAASA